MHAYKSRTFARWMKREGLADRDLRNALAEMQNGLVDVRLGGGLVKKRIARAGQGKSGGYRVLVASNLTTVGCFCSALQKMSATT